jgi:hypothetical protein
VFKAVALRNQGHPREALAQLNAVDETQLSAFSGLVDQLRTELESQVNGTSSTPTTSPSSAPTPSTPTTAAP